MFNYTKLDNGIRIATDRMTEVETVSLSMWVDTGARYETPEENGISHLLEHMAFKGTKRRTARQIAEEFDCIGGQSNAYTSREHTVYYAKTLKNDADKALDILCDILQNSVIDEEELTKEIDVVLQEIASSHDSPDDIIFDYHQLVAFQGQALGRPVLGTPESVKSFTTGKIHNYIKNHYINDRIVVSAAGNIDHAKLVELVQQHFSAAKPEIKVQKEAAEYKGGEFFEKRKLNQLQVVLGFKALSYSDPKYYILQLLSTILGAGMSSRLFQEVREKRGLAYAIQPFISGFSDSGLFSIYAGTSPDKAEELTAVICDELKKMTGDISDAEMARGKMQMKAGILMEQESTNARADELGKNIVCFGRPITAQEISERIESISAGEINALMAEILAGPKPSLAAIGPGKNLPDYEKILGNLK